MEQPVYRHPALSVRACEFGWGVYTQADLAAGVVVERCPFLVVPEDACVREPLRDYVFRLSDERSDPNYTMRAMPLGWGGLFNHANAPNLKYSTFLKRRLLQFTTARAIVAGEQLFVSYGSQWWKDRHLRPSA